MWWMRPLDCPLNMLESTKNGAEAMTVALEPMLIYGALSNKFGVYPSVNWRNDLEKPRI